MGKVTQLIALLALLLVVASCSRPMNNSVATVSETPPSSSSPPVPKVAQASIQPLFVIERSKNANIVRYDAHLTADGKLDPEKPVTAYWVLLAEDGRRQELSWVQKQKAYGFTVEPNASADGYTMTMVVIPERKIIVKKAGDVVHAELIIDGHPAVLEKIYIQSSAGLLGPKVEYIEIYGKDLETGEERVERIVPQY